MIYSELINVFKSDLQIEYFKRRIPENEQLRLNKKQLKVLFTKTASDLQKEFKIVETVKTITSVANEATYALDRSFMTLIDAYYDTQKLIKKDRSWIESQSTSVDSPIYYALKWVNAYPYILLYPTPNQSGKNIVVRSYNDIEIYSYNDGIDSKVSTDDIYYLKIPTQYDQAMLLGMMSQLFEDRFPFYEKEKLRLKGLRHQSLKLEYNMTGIPKSENGYYNSDLDETPSTLPSEPTY